MAGENYEINSNPVYDPDIPALTTSTPGHADHFNQRFKQIINNVHAVKLAEDLLESELTEISKTGGKTEQELTALDSALSSVSQTASEAYSAALTAQTTANSKADSGHSHAATDISAGTLPPANGGTGQTTLQLTRSAMGLGNTTGALPLANGGTGAATAAAALTALGAVALAGGTMTAALYASTDTAYTTSKMRNIYATTTDLTAGSSSLANGSICLVYE